MDNNAFSRQERARRIKAMWITVVVHLLLFGGILFLALDGKESLDSVLPEPVKEWLKMNPEPEANETEGKRA